MDELPDLPALRIVEPPPGGLEALREKLDAPPRRRWLLLAIPAAALAVAVVVLLLVGRPRPMAPAVSAPPTALRDRSVGDTFYWVASRPDSQRARRDDVISIDQVPTVTSFSMP